MYQDNAKVLDRIDYSAQFYSYGRFRYTELPENNCSLSISNLRIHDYKKYGTEIAFEPISDKSFRLFSVGLLFDSVLGTFLYDRPVQTEDFTLTLHRKQQGTLPARIQLNADKHYIFDKIISKNLSASVDKDNPFLTISLLDTLPGRAERYIKRLIDDHIQRSIGMEIEDADIILASINSQILKLEKKVRQSAEKMQNYKSQQKLIIPSVQAEMVLKGNVDITEKLLQTRYQRELLKNIISNTRKSSKIGAIGPSLVELQDKSTILLVQKLQELELEAKSLSQEFKPLYPKLKNTRGQIDSIRSKIKSNLKNMSTILKQREKRLQALKGEYAQKLKEAPKAELEMANILRDFKLNEKFYAYLLQKRAATELKKAEAMSRFRTIEPIYTNPAPAKPKKALIVIVGFITALILSIFLAFFREFLRGGKAR